MHHRVAITRMVGDASHRNIGNDTRWQTFGQGMRPCAIILEGKKVGQHHHLLHSLENGTKDNYLTCGAQTFSFKLHAIDTLEVDDVTQIHPGAFQPPVGQPARRATIDFLAFRFHSTPLFVFAASSSGIPHLLASTNEYTWAENKSLVLPPWTHICKCKSLRTYRPKQCSELCH